MPQVGRQHQVGCPGRPSFDGMVLGVGLKHRGEKQNRSHSFFAPLTQPFFPDTASFDLQLARRPATVPSRVQPIQPSPQSVCRSGTSSDWLQAKREASGEYANWRISVGTRKIPGYFLVNAKPMYSAARKNKPTVSAPAAPRSTLRLGPQTTH